MLENTGMRDQELSLSPRRPGHLKLYPTRPNKQPVESLVIREV